MSKLHITISGNIATGKTSLTRLLSSAFDWTPYYEDLAELAFHPKFCHDPLTWSLHNQLEFLIRCGEQHEEIASTNTCACQDTNIYETFEVFTVFLRDIGMMTQSNFELCKYLYRLLDRMLPPPHLLVYLKADLDVILSRISRRNRVADRFLTQEILEALNERYNSWAVRFDRCRVVSIDTSSLDFVNNPSHLVYLIQLVTESVNRITQTSSTDFYLAKV